MKHIYILVPNSCHVYQAYGATESGDYLIDPDGVGNHQPFSAYCDFENGNQCI